MAKVIPKLGGIAKSPSESLAINMWRYAFGYVEAILCLSSDHFCDIMCGVSKPRKARCTN